VSSRGSRCRRSRLGEDDAVDLIEELVSDPVLEASYEWLCRHRSPDAGAIWCFRRDWPHEKRRRREDLSPVSPAERPERGLEGGIVSPPPCSKRKSPWFLGESGGFLNSAGPTEPDGPW
jgi:hypothetical protein